MALEFANGASLRSFPNEDEQMKQILLADDNEAITGLIAFYLKRQGYVATTCDNGEDALQLGTTQAFDLLLLDQQMPRLTGTEVLAEIRTRGPNRHKPAVLCTAIANQLDLETLVPQLLINRVVEKPFSPQDLIDIIFGLVCEEEPVANA